MAGQNTAHVGIAQIELHLPGCQSLKEKRRIVKSLSDKVRKKWNISFSELDSLDKWQYSTVGMCMISNDQHHIDSSIQKILTFIESFYEAEVIRATIEYV